MCKDTVSRGCGFQDQDFKTIRTHWNPLRFNWNGRIKATQNLRQFLKGFISDGLTDDRTVWPNPDQHLSARPFMKAQRVSPALGN
jgi:hypothetical protein